MTLIALEIAIILAFGVGIAAGVIWLARVDREVQREIREDLDRWSQ